jgi:hypothetical protein
MRWKLVWGDLANERQADLLAGADVRVILAVSRVVAVLEHCPRSFGESRAPGERYGFELPLGVRYEIDEAERVVRVMNVWRVSRGPGDDEPTGLGDGEP